MRRDHVNSGRLAESRMSAFGAKRTFRGAGLRPLRSLLTDTVEKGFWGRSLNNIDSRSNATAQSRFKNPFVRIRLFQILIPQLHFGDFFNSLRRKRTNKRSPRYVRLVPILLQKSVASFFWSVIPSL